MASKKYLDHLCEHALGIRYVFIVSVLSILVLLGSLTMISSGTGTFYIAIIQLVTFVGLVGLSFALMVVCNRNDPPGQQEL